jgi:thymidylate synthase (FAD)
MITEPKVTVWGYTVMTQELLDFLPPAEEDAFDEDGTARPLSAADYIGSAAGKICYARLPNWRNPATNTVEKYVKNILDLEHYSVLAHASITLYIEGVSRALTHELVRHRFLGFSQASQRYQDSGSLDWVCPPLALDDEFAQWLLGRQFDAALTAYDDLYDQFAEANEGKFDKHMLRKRSREAARAVLPNMTETQIVVSGNYRAWRDFLLQRLDPTADLEIMRLGDIVLGIMRQYAEQSFSDIAAKFDR